MVHPDDKSVKWLVHLIRFLVEATSKMEKMQVCILFFLATPLSPQLEDLFPSRIGREKFGGRKSRLRPALLLTTCLEMRMSLEAGLGILDLLLRLKVWVCLWFG